MLQVSRSGKKIKNIVEIVRKLIIITNKQNNHKKRKKKKN